MLCEGFSLKRTGNASSTKQGAALQSHPGRKNKNAARIGHPNFRAQGVGKDAAVVNSMLTVTGWGFSS